MKPLIPWFEPFSINFTDSFGIHGFGILVALGFWVGSNVGMAKAKRDGMDPQIMYKHVVWVVLSTFIGGHIGHLVMYEGIPEDPLEWFKVWQGLSSTGGIVTSIVVSILFFRKHKVNVLAYGDIAIYAFAVGWTLGRLGCFVAHDHPGIVSDFWLAVQPATDPIRIVNGVKTIHSMCPEADATKACLDLGLIEAIWSGLTALWFWWLDKKPRFPGFFIAVIAISYGIFRFFSDFLRHPSTDTRYLIDLLPGGGWTPAQFFCLLLPIAGGILWWIQKDKPPARVAVATGPVAPEPANTAS